MYPFAQFRTAWPGEWPDGVAAPRLDFLNLVPAPVAARTDQPAVRPDGTVFRRWLRAARPGVTTAR
ncbi:MAG: hypothetical protein V3S95_02355 [Alphaproteobacteria bacterium]